MPEFKCRVIAKKPYYKDSAEEAADALIDEISLPHHIFPVEVTNMETGEVKTVLSNGAYGRKPR